MLAGVTFIAGMLYARDISTFCLNDLYGVKVTAAAIFENGILFWILTYWSVVDVSASQGSARKFGSVSSKNVKWLPRSLSVYVSKGLLEQKTPESALVVHANLSDETASDSRRSLDYLKENWGCSTE